MLRNLKKMVFSSKRFLSSSRRMVKTRRFTTAISKVKDTGKLFEAISDLNRYGIKLRNFPSVVAVGPQSSGKTSVIEAICGQTLFPKDMNMATMKPFKITTIKSKHRKFEVHGQKFDNDYDAIDYIERLNNNPSIKDVELKVYDPDVYNAYLTDLPGLFYVSKKDADLPEKIRQMSEDHLQDLNNIPLVVSASTQDPATNQALQLVYSNNRENDSLGILTKMDLTKNMKTSGLVEMLNKKSESFNLAHGWVGLVLRNKRENEMGMTVNEKIEMEKMFFKKHPEFSPSGVITMRKMISDIQYSRIRDNIPRIILEVDKIIKDLKNSGDFLSKVANNPKDKLSIKLKMMIEKLVGSSLERAEFEDILKNRFKKEIGAYVEKTFSSNDAYVPEFSESNIDSSISNYHSHNKSDPSMYETDTFKELFDYGEISPRVANRETIHETFKRESVLGSTIPMFDFDLDDPLGKKRNQWYKYLRKYFASLLEDDNIPNMVYEITQEEMIKYIVEDSTDALTQKFAEYMINEIGSVTYQSDIRYSIIAMINTEKRPKVSLVEMCRYLTQMYRSHFTFDGSFFELVFRNNKKLKIDVYGTHFNEAYLRVVSDNLEENIYRNVAVNLLDKMVEKLLEMTIDMFNKENVIKEKNRVDQKIKKLEEMKKIIKEFE